jgi:hypothetical protein
MTPEKGPVHFSVCARCGRPVRHAVSCPMCGKACCRWDCYVRHLDHHPAGRPAPQPEPQQTDDRSQA